MKGLKAVSDATQKIIQKDKSTWVPLYYNVTEQAVYMKEGEGRVLLTHFINPVTPKEVEETVLDMMRRW